MNFQRLLDCAREEAAQSVKQIHKPSRASNVITKVLDYLLELDEDGFDGELLEHCSMTKLVDLFAFEQRVMPYFQGSSTEYRLECTSAHEEFQGIVDDKLHAFLKKEGWTPDEFYERMRLELSEMTHLSSEHEHAQELVRMIHDAFDFDSWAQSMRYSANALARIERHTDANEMKQSDDNEKRK